MEVLAIGTDRVTPHQCDLPRHPTSCKMLSMGGIYAAPCAPGTPASQVLRCPTCGQCYQEVCGYWFPMTLRMARRAARKLNRR